MRAKYDLAPGRDFKDTAMSIFRKCHAYIHADVGGAEQAAFDWAESRGYIKNLAKVAEEGREAERQRRVSESLFLAETVSAKDRERYSREYVPA